MALPRGVLELDGKTSRESGAELGFGLTPEVQTGGVGGLPAPSFRGRVRTGHRPPWGPQVQARHPPRPTAPEPRRAGKAWGPAERGGGQRASAPGPRVPAARHEGAGETHYFPPRNDAQLLAPAGGCSRERRGGAGRRGLRGAGKPADVGLWGGGRSSGPAGDAGKPLPPVAERQPLTSGVFLKVNNKPRGGGGGGGSGGGCRSSSSGGGHPLPRVPEAADCATPTLARPGGSLATSPDLRWPLAITPDSPTEFACWGRRPSVGAHSCAFPYHRVDVVPRVVRELWSGLERPLRRGRRREGKKEG